MFIGSKRFFVCLVCLGMSAVSLAEDGVWELGARTVPAPAGVSGELHDSIEATPQPNVEVGKNSVPKNDDEWNALIDARSGARAVPLSALEQRFGVKIVRDTIEGVPVYHVTPNEIDPVHANHLFLHVHGGAYVFGGGDEAVLEAAVVASAAKMPALSIDYRMPPKHPFPAAVNDVATVYQWLLKRRPAKSIAIGGTSTGGGLSLASVHKFRALGLETPGAIYAGTPWADLTKTGDTLFTNEGLDRILVTYDGVLGAAAELYGGGHDLKDPLISPVYGDFEGFPPTYFVTGTRDMFLSDTARTHRKMRRAGVIADLNVFEGMSHAGYIVVLDSPESRELFSEIGKFFEAHLASK